MKIKKTFSILFLLGILPFILVWLAFVLTGFSFNPIHVFQGGTFWGVSVLYWFLYVCLIGVIAEVIEENDNC
jgi:hypothetical protein